jgi:hypothetical protein
MGLALVPGLGLLQRQPWDLPLAAVIPASPQILSQLLTQPQLSY